MIRLEVERKVKLGAQGDMMFIFSEQNVKVLRTNCRFRVCRNRGRDKD